MSKRDSEKFNQEAVAYALSNKDKPLKVLAASLGVGYSMSLANLGCAAKLWECF